MCAVSTTLVPPNGRFDESGGKITLDLSGDGFTATGFNDLPVCAAFVRILSQDDGAISRTTLTDSSADAPSLRKWIPKHACPTHRDVCALRRNTKSLPARRLQRAVEITLT